MNHFRGSRRSGLGLLGRLPWWVGVSLAVISYLVLHALATTPPREAKSRRPDSVVTSVVVRNVAGGLQWVIPGVFLLGAVVSAVRRARRRRLLESAVAGGVEGISRMDWREFELLVGEAFRQRGYRVGETGGGGADGGVDLVLHRQGARHLVQCKHWRARQVGVTVVRELAGVMAAEGATGGFLVCSGDFTREARDFAARGGVALLDGPALLELLYEGRVALEGPAGSLRREPILVSPEVPRCPVCGRPMVSRTARKGANAGTAFWGCTSYPACRGARAISQATP